MKFPMKLLEEQSNELFLSYKLKKYKNQAKLITVYFFRLDAINPKLNQFSNKAYCLPYWHAPASNPGLNYNPSSDHKPGCVKYVKEEWENAFTPRFGKANGWRNSMDIF